MAKNWVILEKLKEEWGRSVRKLKMKQTVNREQWNVVCKMENVGKVIRGM
jgi:hypothetical protein